MTFKSFSLMASLILAGSAAQAAVVNFNGLSGSFATYSEQGVTFLPIGGGTFDATSTPNGTNGLLGSGSPRQELRANIAAGTTSVSVDLGDFNADSDLLFLEIFNSSNVSLGFASLVVDSADSAMHTLSLSNPNISYAVFGGRAPSLNGSSVYADNFTFAAAAGVPEPGAILLTASGLFALLLRRRARKS